MTMKTKRKKPSLTGPSVPIGPFQQWMIKMIVEYEGINEFAEMIQVNERTLRRWLKAHPEFPIKIVTVDWCLTNEESTILEQLYPHSE